MIFPLLGSLDRLPSCTYLVESPFQPYLVSLFDGMAPNDHRNFWGILSADVQQPLVDDGEDYASIDLTLATSHNFLSGVWNVI